MDKLTIEPYGLIKSRLFNIWYLLGVVRCRHIGLVEPIQDYLRPLTAPKLCDLFSGETVDED